jgi:hypothetical protein
MKTGFLIAICLFTAVLFVSCNGEEKEKAVTETQSVIDHDHSAMEHRHHEPSGESVLVCPVMGTEMQEEDAIKFTHNGYEFTLCCAACIPEIMNNFEKYKEHGRQVN